MGKCVKKENIEPAKFSAEDHAGDVTWLTSEKRRSLSSLLMFTVNINLFISFFTEKCLVQTIQILTPAISVFLGKGTENMREILA